LRRCFFDDVLAELFGSAWLWQPHKSLESLDLDFAGFAFCSAAAKLFELLASFEFDFLAADFDLVFALVDSVAEFAAS
jgi:hypothetical protein